MGWWWSSAPNQDGPQSPPPQAAPPQPPPSNAEPSSLPAHLRPVTRDELAEAELQSFLKGLRDGSSDSQSSPQPAPTTQSQQSNPPPPPSQQPSSSSSSHPQSTNQDILPESLYPTTMSCRSAFDMVWFCQSLGGQWVNVYRYGEMRSCSEQWNDFWFCMRTKSYPEEEKGKMIADHYRKKAVKYKTGPSSEDIWDVRTEPVKDAFQGDFAELERRMKEAERGAEVEMKAVDMGDGRKGV
ncbi:hypothetical protein FQN50_000595 [Emmonsiellopsis sp. PD_5]|nr:hypothetical protein FQN50_000595 [Emmonsiellopsis sp. PD_5]